MSIHEIKQHGTEDFPIGLYLLDKEHPRYEMAFHWHTSAEIVRVLEGELFLTLNGKEYTLHAGEAAFINSETVHGAMPKDCRYECLVFSLPFLSRGERSFDRFLDGLIARDCRVRPILTVPSLLAEVNTLFEAAKSTEAGTRFFVLGALYRLFGEIVRLSYYDGEREGFAERDGKKVARLKKALAYMRENYRKDLSLEEISGSVGLSTRYFCSFFKSLTGKTPIEYLNSYRIEKACDKLTDTDTAVTQIAYSTGFNDLSYFIKTFKGQMGCSPSAYRKNNG